MPFLFLEFLGTTELLVIAVVALVLFGPRKLPQIGHSIGKALSEFKRSSEDFKRTWEMEVNMETADKEARIENAISPVSPSTPVYARGAEETSYSDDATDSYTSPYDSDVVPETASAETPAAAVPPPTAAPAPRKQDWL